MKALVYEGPGKITLADKPKPVPQAPGDAVVRVTLTTICGTDLHSIKGARWATKAWGWSRSALPSATPRRLRRSR